MGFYAGRALGRFGEGVDGGTPVAPPQWQFPTGEFAPTAPVDPVTGIPYYLAKSGDADVVYGPEYRPELLTKPLPSWVIPAAVGTGVFVLFGGLGLILGTRKRRR